MDHPDPSIHRFTRTHISNGQSRRRGNNYHSYLSLIHSFISHIYNLSLSLLKIPSSRRSQDKRFPFFLSLFLPFPFASSTRLPLMSQQHLSPFKTHANKTISPTLYRLYSYCMTHQNTFLARFLTESCVGAEYELHSYEHEFETADRSAALDLSFDLSLSFFSFFCDAFLSFYIRVCVSNPIAIYLFASAMLF